MLLMLSVAIVAFLCSNGVDAGYQPPAVPAGSYQPSYSPKPLDGFVTTSNGSLYHNGKPFNVRSMNAPNLFAGSAFNTIDTLKTMQGLGAPVTRTYAIATVVNSQYGGYSEVGLITGWDSARQDWIYNETLFRQIDRNIALTAQYGVKIIVPIVNQDYGKPDSDYVGNFNDLIRMRYNISDYAEAQAKVDWFTDPTMRVAFKQIIAKVLTRRNTVNGRIYGKDDTFLAWETGNEMNWGEKNNTIHQRPAPAEWTIDVAKYIKSFAPKTLVMDGSFSRNGVPEASFPVEVMKSPYIDLMSYHYYGNGDQDLFAAQNAYVRSFGKTFVIGEHGFYNTGPDLAIGYQKYAAAAGALLWGMRPHSDLGGFIVHGEGGNIYSYHFPGWPNQTDPQFDTREYDATHSTYTASWEILGLPVPKYPVPDRPELFDASNATAKGLSWRGATWAYSYELWAASLVDGFKKVGSDLLDNVAEGKLFVPIQPSNPPFQIEIPELHSKPQSPSNWKDPKWSGPSPQRGNKRSIEDAGIESRSDETSFNFHQGRSPAEKPHHQQMVKSNKMKKGYAKDIFGTWYLLRGVSVDGIPGPFSKPLLIHA